ncbi:MAG TPA: hypothetical protein VFS43_18595, partial [Polyangiaceae bacterium]|nr:hypothetical protein [Polyangiaceae bacterium]
LERLARPKRARRGKPAPEPQAAPGLALLPAVEGPGRYAVLGWDEPVELRATRYVDPDGLVRYRVHLPEGGGYRVVLVREATEEERNEAAAQAAKERAR